MLYIMRLSSSGQPSGVLDGNSILLSEIVLCFYLNIGGNLTQLLTNLSFGPVIFHHSECCILQQMHCQVLISHARLPTGLLCPLTHLSRLCSSILVLPQCMGSCLQAILSHSVGVVLNVIIWEMDYIATSEEVVKSLQFLRTCT